MKVLHATRWQHARICALKYSQNCDFALVVALAWANFHTGEIMR